MSKSKQTNQVEVFLVFFILHSLVRYYKFTVANNEWRKQHVRYKAIKKPIGHAKVRWSVLNPNG